MYFMETLFSSSTRKTCQWTFWTGDIGLNSSILQDSLQTWLNRMAAITTMWWATNLFSTYKTGVHDALCCVCMIKGEFDEFRNINTKQLYYQFVSRTGLWSGSVIFQYLYWIMPLKVLDDLVEASVWLRDWNTVSYLIALPQVVL